MTPRALLATAWTIAILLACWLPDFVLREAKVAKPLIVLNLDKFVHFGIFAVFAWLWMRAATIERRGWIVLVAGITLAVVSELGQQLPFVNRDAGLDDGIADVGGVVAGIAAYSLTTLRKKPRLD